MKITLGVIIAAAVVAALFSWYAGFFSSVVINEKNWGPVTIVYQEHRGEYSKVGPTMDEVYQKLQADDIAASRGIGIYYDDPASVPAVDLRSEVGSIIEDSEQGKFEFVQDKYLTKTIAEQKFVVAEFPYRTKTSIIAGVFKVYPKLQAYLAEKNYGSAPIMEIYDLPNKKIYYLTPVSGTLELIEPVVEEPVSDNYDIAEVLDQDCQAKEDCQTPDSYLLRSNCPYESRCLEGKCTVVCPRPAEQLIGGQRDEHGCLGPAGYSWQEEIQACARGWEITDEDQIKAAKLAVADFGPVNGLTVLSVETLRCPGCFTVTLQQDTERQALSLSDWKVVKTEKME